MIREFVTFPGTALARSRPGSRLRRLPQFLVLLIAALGMVGPASIAPAMMLASQGTEEDSPAESSPEGNPAEGKLKARPVGVAGHSLRRADHTPFAAPRIAFHPPNRHGTRAASRPRAWPSVTHSSPLLC